MLKSEHKIMDGSSVNMFFAPSAAIRYWLVVCNTNIQHIFKYHVSPQLSYCISQYTLNCDKGNGTYVTLKSRAITNPQVKFYIS